MVRKGWDEKNVNAVEVARVAQESGAKACFLIQCFIVPGIFQEQLSSFENHSALHWERRSVASVSATLRNRSEPQTSASRQMNDDLAVLRSVRS